MENNSEDMKFKELMAKSMLQVPDLDFDEKVMFRINRGLSKKASYSKDLKLSWLFFILGSVFGIFVSLILPMIQTPVLGIELNKISILFQIIFTFLLMLQFNNLLSFYKRNFS